MEGNAVFEGDVLLKMTNDGADLVIENALVACDRHFDTAVLLSLFGGNMEDDGRVESTAGWWGNYTGTGDAESAGRKLVSKYQAVTTSGPLTASSAKAAVSAAKEDLAWLIDEGVCDAMEITGEIAGVKTLTLAVTCIKEGADVYSGKYALQWGDIDGASK